MEAVNNPAPRASGKCRLAFSTSGDDFRETREDFSASRPAAKSGCGTPTSSNVGVDKTTGRGGRPPLHLRPSDAAVTPDGRKVKGTIHCSGPAVSGRGSASLRPSVHEARPGRRAGGRTIGRHNEMLEVLSACKLEPSLAAAKAGDRIQFERLGYFAWTRTRPPEARVQRADMRDTWAKIEKRRSIRRYCEMMEFS